MHLVLPGGEAGGALPVTNRHMLMARLYALPLHWHLHSTLQRVEPDGSAHIDARGNGPTTLPGSFDCVVYGSAREANAELLGALEGARTLTYASAGDCVAPRSLFAAVREGYDAVDRLAAALTS